MTNTEITKTLQKLNGIWGNLDRRNDRDRYREYGEFLQGYEFDYMIRAIETLRGASTFLPKQAELKDIYNIEIRKEEEQKKINAEKARRERGDEEYHISCMVCLDAGVIWRDEMRTVGGVKHKYTMSYYCDQCEIGTQKTAKSVTHDDKGRKLAVENIDKPISAVMDPNQLRERNGIKFESSILTHKPSAVHIRLVDLPEVPADKIKKAKEFLSMMGIGEKEGF